MFITRGGSFSCGRLCAAGMLVFLGAAPAAAGPADVSGVPVAANATSTTAAASRAAATPHTAPTPAVRRKGEAEFLIPPGGGVVDVPVHALTICILSFSEKLVPQGVVSSNDVEVQTWGPQGVAVRAKENAVPTTVALVTESGAVRINALIRVVPESEPALTLVRLKPASEEEALQARVAAEVEKKLAPRRADLAELRRGQAERARLSADQTAIAGAVLRSDVVSLDARERNDSHVIAHVTQAVMLGDTAYLLFDLENRSKAPFRVAGVRVFSKRAELATVPTLEVRADARVKALGVVAKNARARGVVAVPFPELVRAGRFTLQVVEVDARQSISVSDLSL